jgi:Tol biopolymer transport system component/C-terminal processing protease CtpA/Prc
MLAVLGALSAGASAQINDASPKRVFGARSLSLSPDGHRIAFTWRGDVWTASSEGGMAMPLTQHVEMDDNPMWSPDGKWIAFSTNRFGGTDIMVVPSTGGEASRITWHPGADSLGGWSADGKEIFFRAQREGSENAIYSINVRTLELKEHVRDHRTIGNPKVSPDGKKLLYTRYGFPVTRPRYHGSGAFQLWIKDLTTGDNHAVLNDEAQHIWPDWTADGHIAFVSTSEITPSSAPLGKTTPRWTDNVNRTPNIYISDTNGKESRATNLVGGSGTRYVATASKSDAMAWEDNGEIYVRQGRGDGTKIEITAGADDKINNEERQVLATGSTEAALDAKGENLIFVASNELWRVPVKQGNRPNAADATQLTDWPGLDRNILWHPDKDAVFFTSDRDGAERLYRMDMPSKALTPISEEGHDVLEVHFAPDKRSVTYWMAGTGGGLFRVRVDSDRAERVLDFPRLFRYENETTYAWSPDGRYLAYTKREPAPSVNIWIYDTQTKEQHNVTRMSAQQGQPAFSADGRFLYFSGNREGGGGGGGGRFGGGGGPTGSIYILPLKEEDARTEDFDLKWEKPTSTPNVDIDFDGMSRRIRTFIAGGGDNLRSDPETGDLLYMQGGQIWKAGYDGQGARALTTGTAIPGFEFTIDGKSLVFVRDGLNQVMDLRKQGNPIQTISFRAEWTRDLRGERRAAFQQFWREYNRAFYDPSFHGRDWNEIGRRYEKLLDGVGHRNEFATLLNGMIGELDASHSEVSASSPAGVVNAEPVGHLGLTFDYSYRGPGIKVLAVPRRSPGSFAKTKIAPGDYIMAINGKDAVLNESLFRQTLLGQSGRDVNLTVNSMPSKEGVREVRIRAISEGAFRSLLYDNRIEDRRKYVEEKSGGKLTYLDIAGMSGGNLATFNFEAWEYIQGKKGVVIDVRNNGGGNISDDLIDLIERRPIAWFFLRDTIPTPSPDRSWYDDIKIAVMTSETSFSDAEIFPSAMKLRGFATLVGMPTPGYVISTYGLPLVDGTSARMPAWGVYRLDGTNMENNGQQPDYKVDYTVDDYLHGVDPQLDKSIEVLMKQIK